jgi:hypothetical protein
MLSLEEAVQTAVDESKKGGDPDKAQVYATLALALAVNDMAHELAVTLDPSRVERALEQLAVEHGGLAIAVGDAAREISGMGTEGHPIHMVDLT